MIDRDAPLTLPEEFLLLALRNREGTTHTYGTYVHALGAAVLAELAAAERVTLDREGKKTFVTVRDSRPLGDAALDAALAKLAAAKRRSQVAGCVGKLAGIRDLKHLVARGLCARGVLRAEEQTVLLLFHRRVYPEVDPRPERALLERLRRAVFADMREVEPRTLRLLALVDSVELLPVLFDKRQVKERRRRVKELVAGDPLHRAVREIIEAAATAAAVGATTAATCS